MTTTTGTPETNFAVPPSAAPTASADHTAALTIGVLAETAAGERRVALDPSAVERLAKAGRAVLVESGAGASATFEDDEYTAAGATLASRTRIIATCTVIPVMRYPDADLARALRSGQLIVGLLDPFTNMADIAALAGRVTTAVKEYVTA